MERGKLPRDCNACIAPPPSPFEKYIFQNCPYPPVVRLLCMWFIARSEVQKTQEGLTRRS